MLTLSYTSQGKAYNPATTPPPKKKKRKKEKITLSQLISS